MNRSPFCTFSAALAGLLLLLAHGAQAYPVNSPLFTSASDANAVAFRAAIKGDGTIAALYAAHDASGIAAAYNQPSATSIWRSNITLREIDQTVDWGEYATLTVAQQGTFEAMIQSGGMSIDATQAGVRNGFSSVFAGKTTLTKLTALAQRLGTKFEAIAAFLTTAGVASVSSFTGAYLTPIDVQVALWDSAGAPL